MRRACAASFVLLAFAAAPAAQAKPLPPGFAAAQQYVEVVPTSGGSTPAGGHETAPPAALPAPVASRLRHAGATGAALQKVATSPAYGAPATPSHPHASSGGAARHSQPTAHPVTARRTAPVPAVPGPVASAGRLFSASAAVQALAAAAAAAAVAIVGVGAARLRRGL